ncbi:hypothetical protein HUK80_01890 [Flavobacterium sp. MAH-1]|uniref:Phosphoribosylpyrophosphate synthetase n=2 Tax=Flavobacterium agri TaxID=2743471 RepID=A0A7Y8XZ73_9FLAO|nr:hypothetical protein [Flavobacterium agri]NYA69656.1 hypothetical protein [Flavobacterium agri]
METTRQFHYGTVLEAITILREQGYGHDFTVYDGKLKADGRFFCPDELEITDVYRYEGDTDPADEAIVFALSAQCGLKGILVAGYGADTDGSGQLIAQLHYRYLRP